jgi:DNA-binding GntR family transcriptional regulator
MKDGAMTLGTDMKPARLDRHRQAAPQVFDELRGRIISLRLAPGTIISRADLMSQFGVSITPIRDALLRLCEEGLVDIFPQHATVVSPIDLSLAYQAQFLRRSIELEVVRTLSLAVQDGFTERLRATSVQQKAVLEADDKAED